MAVRMRALLTAAALAIGLGSCGAEAAADRQTPSGLPVPRYVSLKFNQVNARAGPGNDHRLLWVYRVRGLPLQVVAETAEWRRVCDPDGALVWVHKRTTDGRRMTINTHGDAWPLRKRPKLESRVVAYLNSRAMATLIRCEEDWCRVRAGDVTGWVPQGELWGTSDAVQCRAGQKRAATQAR